MWLYKQYLHSPVESVIKARVVLPTKTVKVQEGCLTSYSAIDNNLLKRYATEDNIATVYYDIRTFRQRSLMKVDYEQQLWTKTLRYGSVYTKRILKGLFVEGVNETICRTLLQRLLDWLAGIVGRIGGEGGIFHWSSRQQASYQQLVGLQKKERRWEPRTGRGCEPRGRRVMNVE